MLTVEVNVTGLAGFLLAKAAAARSRRLAKDWHDIAFVLLHNDAGGVVPAADAVRARFGSDLVGGVRTALADLLANLTTPGDQGSRAYGEQMLIDHPELDQATVLADAVLAVEAFHRLFDRSDGGFQWSGPRRGAASDVGLLLVARCRRR